ncbi:hypothetical protein NEIPOLOT_00214 [Neisseria polysaccharea ATCC 43768]|nr:hypothetical protein NEIPOLOT_00214 [Neisseria polysaccharea ATCC 43768]
MPVNKMPSEPLFGRYLIFASLTCLIGAICKKDTATKTFIYYLFCV